MNKPVFEWKEVEKHNTHNDNWMVIHGKVYDVSKWVKTHPGGDIILLGGGRDATIMFESYHASNIDHRLMEKYCIGSVKPKDTFYSFEGEFYPALKVRLLYLRGAAQNYS